MRDRCAHGNTDNIDADIQAPLEGHFLLHDSAIGAPAVRGWFTNTAQLHCQGHKPHLLGGEGHRIRSWMACLRFVNFVGYGFSWA